MRQMLRHAAAALTACGLMALAIAGTDTADGHRFTVTGNGAPLSSAGLKPMAAPLRTHRISRTSPGARPHPWAT